MYKNILVIGSELHSGGLDKSTRGRGVSVIFGDGAGAVVLQRSENMEAGILSTHLHAEGLHAEELALIGPNTGRWVPEIIETNEALADEPSKVNEDPMGEAWFFKMKPTDPSQVEEYMTEDEYNKLIS